jgi:hypothetical protein
MAPKRLKTRDSVTFYLGYINFLCKFNINFNCVNFPSSSVLLFAVEMMIKVSQEYKFKFIIILFVDIK